VNFDKPTIIFVHPYLHHAYFTHLALGATSNQLFTFCPLLIVDLLRGTWKAGFLPFKNCNIFQQSCLMAAVFLALLLKVNLLSHNQYIRLFSILADNFIKHVPAKKIIFYYQDYAQHLNRTLDSSVFKICELIISPNDELDNVKSTIASIVNSDIVVTPNLFPSIPSELLNTKVIVAPYGGNKAQFLTESSLLFNKIAAFDQPTIKLFNINKRRRFIISARANSYRKGLDVLLTAVNFLNSTQASWPRTYDRIDIYICGEIDPQSDLFYKYITLKKLLGKKSKLTIKACKLSQKSYLALLSKSDIFVMPSRVEGSSTAALEALWTSVPTIMTKECGIPQFKDGIHGLHLNNINSRELALLILHALRHPHDLRKWADNLCRDRHIFTWSSYLRAVTKAVDSYQFNS